MKKLLLALIAVALMATNAPSAASRHPKPFDSVRALAWTVDVMSINFNTGEITTAQVFGNHCTVTSINQKKHYWLTAAHCVANEDMSEVEIHDYKIGTAGMGYVPAQIVEVDLADDIAVMATPDGPEVPALKIAKDDVGFGDPIMVVGHPFGWPEAVMFVGNVAHPSLKFDPDDKAYMIYQIAAAPGNSGSAVLDKDNKVVSVLQIGWSRSFANVSGGAPQDVLKRFAGKYFG